MASTPAEDREAERVTQKPDTKVKSKLDKELEQWEVESTKDGQDSLGNG